MANTITFSGLASGMDTSSWIEALTKIKSNQLVSPLNTKLNAVQSSKSTLSSVQAKVSSLRSSIEKLTDAKFGGTFDVFAKNQVSSSNTGVVEATATNDAIRQNLEIEVKKLATATTATSKLGSAGYINEDTLFKSLASGSAKDGSFSIYVDGQRNEITIEEDETIGNILDKISAIDGVNASIESGKISIKAEDGKSIVVGASSDESNFSSIAGLVRNVEEQTGNVSYDSYTTISKVGTSAKLADIFGESVVGTLDIGGATFTVNEDTTMSSFIAAINRNDDAGVSAYWDASAGEIVLKSKVEGSFNINIAAGTSNLSDILGFTTTEQDAEGNKVSKLNEQNLGDYAELTINGTTLISSSNNVTSDISGISGLTLTLKSVSKPNDEGVVEPTTISVEQDDEALIDTINSFITAYNDTISTIDDNTKKGKDLYGDSALNSLRNSLRRDATTTISSSGTYKLLADIGISTGKAANTTDTSSVNKLQLDKEKFLEALKTNPESVKSLLVGDNKGTETSGGVLNKLETVVESSLDSVNGYFDQKTKSYTSTIDSIQTSITAAESRVTAYQTRLQKQFNNMETMISSMRSAFSSLGI